ncbi:hypothetical protein BXU10_05300 [Flavobacterium sp. LM4]|nr:hypothetical protein BXU10_05300 [Flavobacterium sp. LM4]
MDFANKSVKVLCENRNFDKNNRPVTHATTDLGNWLNLKMVLYLKDLANPKIELNLVPNPL